LTLKEVLGNNPSAIANIQNNNQIVFHSTGDCGSTRGPKTQNLVVDKMLADFKETATSEIPQFHILLGDVIYSFGEVKYYYDQFYEPYREYRVRFSRLPETTTAWQLPIRTRPASTASTETFARKISRSCRRPADSRTAQIQPGVFFTFEAPFVTIIVVYSNALEDPASSHRRRSAMRSLLSSRRVDAAERGELCRRSSPRPSPSALHTIAAWLERRHANANRQDLR
jgi:hypothetical protein